jgi:hypothetical protein
LSFVRHKGQGTSDEGDVCFGGILIKEYIRPVVILFPDDEAVNSFYH